MSTDLVVLGLGSNLNNPLNNLRKALSEIKKIQNVVVKNVSSIYESEAQVPENAPSGWNQKFLNAAVLLQVSNTTAIELLKIIKDIEKEIGRTSSEVWAPRCIDIDILYWKDLKINKPELIVPHPRLSDRPFALLPLLQVYSNPNVYKPEWANEWLFEKPFNTVKSKKFFWPEFIGILNITDDSFSDGGEFLSEDLLALRMQKLVADGATILDLGAESTRPGAKYITEDVEYTRLDFALNIFKKLNIKSKISIDSYKPSVIEKCLVNHEIDFINDVNGLNNAKMIQLVKQSGKKTFVMHSVSIPADASKCIDSNADPIEYLQTWWLNKKSNLDIKSQQLIFDPGIGFGKSKQQNLYILNNLIKLSESKKMTDDILIGHSRKSFQTVFSDRPASDRDLETALITQNINLAYCQYLRVHDVLANALALKVR